MVQHRQVRTISHSGIKVFQQFGMLQQCSIQGLVTVFFGDPVYDCIPFIYQWLHMFVMSAFSLCICSQSILMAHQVLAFQLLELFFMSVRCIFFSISVHWLCCKISQWIDQKLWGALRARHVVLILEESNLPLGEGCHFGLGLPFGGAVGGRRLWMRFVRENKKETAENKDMWELKPTRKKESLATPALVSSSTPEWSLGTGGGEGQSVSDYSPNKCDRCL